MIKLKNYTPEVYYNQSRDFQLLGRLFDVVLNSVKTEADLLYNIPLSDNSNDELLELFALTLGFKSNRKYNSKQLRAICKVFPEAIKNKGSIKSIQIICNALFNANRSLQTLYYEVKDGRTLNLYIPQDFEDISLLTNVLDYFLPAGMSCNIIKELIYKKESMTAVSFDDTLHVYNKGDTSDILYDDNLFAAIPQLKLEESNIEVAKAELEDSKGFYANSSIYRPEVTKPTKEETD